MYKGTKYKGNDFFHNNTNFTAQNYNKKMRYASILYKNMQTLA